MTIFFEPDPDSLAPVKQGKRKAKSFLYRPNPKNLAPAKVRKRKAKPILFKDFRGDADSCYCGLAAEIGPNLETTYHLKLGWTCNDMVKRCNAQRLKIVWGVSGELYSEGKLHTRAEKMFGKTKNRYGQAGCTEMFGNFESAEEANEACLRLLETLRADFWDVWVHPKAIIPECFT